jgi:hypothetical protein
MMTGSSTKTRERHGTHLRALFAISELGFLVRHISATVSPPSGPTQLPGHFIYTNINLHNVCIYGTLRQKDLIVDVVEILPIGRN